MSTCKKCGANNATIAVYCEFCGTKLETRPFCKDCGGMTNPQTGLCTSCGKPGAESNRVAIGFDKKTIASFVSSLLALAAIILLLLKWVYISINGESYTLFQIYGFIRDIDSWIETGDIYLLAILVIAMTAMAICFFILHIIFNLFKKKAGQPLGLTAYILTFCIAAFMLFMTVLLNNESDGLWGYLVSLTPVAYITLAVAVTGGIVFAIANHEPMTQNGMAATKDVNDKGILYIPLKMQAVADCGYMNRADIQSVYIPNTIRHIGKRAFYNCKNVKEVRLSDYLVEIDEEAFANCTSLERIMLPANLQSCAANAFAGCDNLELIVAPHTFGVGFAQENRLPYQLSAGQ